jgi:hypothetical protein
MLTPENLSYILGFLGLLSILISAWNHFKNPQIEIEKEQIKSDEELKDKATILSQKEVEAKAQLLAQQVEWQKEATEKRFVEMNLSLKESMTLAQNHIHTVDTKVDKMNENIVLMGKEITRLATIIEERMPKK